MISETLKPMSEIEPEPVKWLWKGRIPLGALTLLAGKPNMGQSLMMSAIASAVTVGRGLPDDDPREPANVLYLSGEDSLSLLKSRLKNAGADLNRVIGSDKIFTLDWLRRQVATHWIKASLVIIDPIQPYLAGDENNGSDVRTSINQLQQLVRELECAIVLVHNVKRLSRDHGSSSQSIEWSAAARSVLYCGYTLTNTKHPALVQTKNNLAEMADPIGYQIESDGDLPSQTRFHWIEV